MIYRIIITVIVNRSHQMSTSWFFICYDFSTAIRNYYFTIFTLNIENRYNGK